MRADTSDTKSPQPESDLPGEVDAHARNELQGDPEAKPPAKSSTPQEAPHHSGGDEMALGAQDEPVSPPKASRSETSFHSAAPGSAGREEGKSSVVSPADGAEEDNHSPIRSKKLFNPPGVTLRTTGVTISEPSKPAETETTEADQPWTATGIFANHVQPQTGRGEDDDSVTISTSTSVPSQFVFLADETSCQ